MKPERDEDIHTYQYSGIQERTGKVPIWLMVVYVALSVWAIYYLWAYWTHP